MSLPLPDAFCPTCQITLWENPAARLTHVTPVRSPQTLLLHLWYVCDCGTSSPVALDLRDLYAQPPAILQTLLRQLEDQSAPPQSSP